MKFSMNADPQVSKLRTKKSSTWGLTRCVLVVCCGVVAIGFAKADLLKGVFPPTAGVAQHFLHIFFEARLGSLRCSNFTLQFTISLDDFFVTLLIGPCALSWCSVPHHRVN